MRADTGSVAMEYILVTLFAAIVLYVTYTRSFYDPHTMELREIGKAFQAQLQNVMTGIGQPVP